MSVRLGARRGEIEETILTRINAIAPIGSTSDSEYEEGLRVAVSAALEYGLAAIEFGEERSPPLPPVLLGQARLAARSGVSLEAVLRRYLAGYTLLGDFLIEEAVREAQLSGPPLKRLLREQATLFDRLVAAVSEEYGREVPEGLRSGQRQPGERVQRLLEGELLDTSEIAYDFAGSHLGLVAVGLGAADAIRELATTLDHCLLFVDRGDRAIWAWLGGRREVSWERLEDLVRTSWPPRTHLALGEPGNGLRGWRLTHRQAEASLPIALRGGERFVRYADVALLASMLRDDLLMTSLRELYLIPLERGRDDGAVARETLRAYFTAERNVSSTASALGVNRQTVTNRLRSIEDHLGRSLNTCVPEIDAALRLEDLLPRNPPSAH